jgi:MFS family permease
MSRQAIIAAVFLAFGAAAGSYAGSIPVVLAESGTSKETFGVIIMVNTLAYVVTMWWGSRHLDALGPRRALLLALPLHVAALAVILASQSSAMLFVGSLLYSLGAGTVDLAMNAEGAAIERRDGRPVLAKFHGMVSAVIAVCAMTGSLAAATVGTWPSSLFAALAFLAVWMLVRCLPFEAARSGPRVHSRFKPSRPAMLLGLIFGLSVCGESAAFMWSAKALSEMAPSLLIVAGAGVCFFASCQALGRFLADGLRTSLGDVPLLMGSVALAALGLAIVAASPWFALSLLGFAMTGFGAAAVVPIVFALATGLDTQARAAGLGFVSLVAGVPRVILPFVFGYLAQNHSNGAAFGVTSLALVAALALAFVYAKGSLTAGSFRSPRISPADGT